MVCVVCCLFSGKYRRRREEKILLDESGKQDSFLSVIDPPKVVRDDGEVVVILSTAAPIWITFVGGEQKQHRVLDEEKLSRLQLVYRNQTEIIPVISVFKWVSLFFGCLSLTATVSGALRGSVESRGLSELLVVSQCESMSKCK